MPYKARLQEGQERKRKKPTYRVTNCQEYNQSLKERGKISLYFPDGDLKSQFINASPYTRGVSGRTSCYLAPYIELIYTFYRLLSWGMRQITGYMRDYWKTLGLDIPVPSFGHLGDLFSELDIAVKQRCKRLARRLANSEDVTVIIDSTGLSFDRASQWYEEKYGRKADRTPWRKMHLAIDPYMNIHAIEITGTDVSDREGMDRILPTDIPIDRVIADGAYYSIERAEALNARGIVAVIPPPSHAVVHGAENTKLHDQTVQYILDRGSVYAFHKKHGYGLRALVEAQISRNKLPRRKQRGIAAQRLVRFATRLCAPQCPDGHGKDRLRCKQRGIRPEEIKRCIGAKLLTQKLESQKREGVVIANIINLWNSFGRPVSVKNA